MSLPPFIVLQEIRPSIMTKFSDESSKCATKLLSNISSGPVNVKFRARIKCVLDKRLLFLHHSSLPVCSCFFFSSFFLALPIIC